MIEGLKVKKLKIIPDERGHLMEMFRRDDEAFIKFGQTYLSGTHPGAVKAWHYHKIQFDNFVCVKGMIKLVCYDNRPESSTYQDIDELFIGEKNQCLVTIPNNVYHGWKCISESESWVIKCCTEMYNYKEPDEYRLDPHNNDVIPYEWKRKDG